jgi:D-amino-acid dehydrogenase
MAKIIVIGAGAVGISTAYFLCKSGHEVVLIEKNSSDNFQSCSYGNAGMIVPSHFIPLASPGVVRQGLKWLLNRHSPLYIRPGLKKDLWRWLWLFYRSANPNQVKNAIPVLRDLNLFSRDLFAKIAEDEKLDFGFRHRGLMMYFNTMAGKKEELHTAQLAQELDLPVEILTPSAIREMEPDMPLNVLGGIHYKCDAHLTPMLYMQKMTAWLQQQGVKFLFDADVVGFIQNNKRITAICTSHENITADAFVISAGAWSSGLCKHLHIHLPIQPGKGYNFSIPNAPSQMNIPSILCEARIAITPMANSLRIGGTMEIGSMNTTVSPTRIQGILQNLPEYLPAFNATWISEIPVWAGLRPCSPDGLPYIGKIPAYTNLIAASGHAMMGMSLAPVTGKIVADIIDEKQPAVAIDLLKPDRFN